MSDRTLASEKDIKDFEETTLPKRTSKRRNAIYMGESEKAKLIEEISKETQSIFTPSEVFEGS